MGEKELMDRIIQFSTANVSLEDAIEIVKYKLDNPYISIETKTMAIGHVARMETDNSITRQELIRALQWLFIHYDFT